jgi:hypothetical protein
LFNAAEGLPLKQIILVLKEEKKRLKVEISERLEQIKELEEQIGFLKDSIHLLEMKKFSF